MTHFTNVTASLAVATSFFASPAFADIKGEDVWNRISAYYGALGITLTSEQYRVGNTYVIRDIKAVTKFPYKLGSATLTTDKFTLIDNDDGSVTFYLDKTEPVAIAISLPDDKFATATIAYTQDGYNVRATGTPDNITILYSIDAIQATLENVDFSDKGAMVIKSDMVMQGFTASVNLLSDSSIKDTLTYKQTSTIDAFSYNWTVDIPADESNQTAVHMETSSSTKTYGLTTEIVLPASGIDLQNLPHQLRNGLSFNARSTTKSSIATSGTQSGGTSITHQNSTAGITETNMAISQDGLMIDATVNDFSVDALIQELPIQINLHGEKVSAKIKAPILQSELPKDVNYALDLTEITINDDLWALFDPSNALPRDPANISLDLTATVRSFFDLVDFPALQNAFSDGETMGEIDSLTLNNLHISAVGADIVGTGAFTFDNSDKTTFGGIPAPNGSATFTLKGAYALLDTLTSMGLVPEDQAMGARMMMGVFLKPSEAEDILTSVVEIKPNGEISANGQRLK